MLADPKMEGFVDGFARQWLKIDEFGRFPPDEQIYPDYLRDRHGGDRSRCERRAAGIFPRSAAARRTA